MKLAFLTIALFIAGTFSAQTTEAEKVLKTQDKDTTTGWSTGGIVGLTFSQVQQINWAAGGLNSIATNANLNLFADYRVGKISWKNSLDLAYGIIRQGNEDANWLKSDDRIDLTSKFGRKISDKMYFGALYNFRSQFSDGYSDATNTTIISRFASPAYSLLAVGFDYSPNKVWSAFFAPVTLKTTIVADATLANAGAFGVEAATYDDLGAILTEGKMIRNEFGGYFRFKFKKDIIENVNFETKLDLFSNYLENPQNIDINWQVLIAMKINKYMTANITTHLIYDHDIDIAVDSDNDGIYDATGPRVQFKEALGIGLSYKFK